MSKSAADASTRLADHSADWRMTMLAAAALVIGTGGALGACRVERR